MIKQYVNIDWDFKTMNYGVGVHLKATIDESGPPGSSDEQVAYFFLETDKKNAKPQWVPSANRAVGFFSKPPHRVSAKIKDKKVTTVAAVSKVGGDKFKFKIGQKDDKSDAKDYPDLEIETWRKVFVRVGRGPGCTKGRLGDLKANLDPVFVELEQEGGDNSVRLPGILDSVVGTIGRMNKGKPEPKYPLQTVHLVYVDRIAAPKVIEVDRIFTPREIKNNKVQTFAIDGGQFTWPNDKDWLAGGEIERLEDNFETRESWKNLGDIVTKATNAGTSHKHDEGVAGDHLSIDFGKLGQFVDAWADKNDGMMFVKLKVRVLSKMAGGKADSRLPYIIVARRNSLTNTAYSSSTITKITLHELGHQLGLALRYMPEFSEDKGEFSGRTSNIFWYLEHGGVGNHCKRGANTSSDPYTGGTCTMFHQVSAAAYCSVCQLILKRANLAKLGRMNVWDAGMGWDEKWTP